MPQSKISRTFTYSNKNTLASFVISKFDCLGSYEIHLNLVYVVKFILDVIFKADGKNIDIKSGKKELIVN